jgi:hypothetical protein
MLLLKPNCECCSTPLAANSVRAYICSYEFTFCADCVEHVRSNVCPNCGGGFCPRPVRPLHAYRPGLGLVHHPASEKLLTSQFNDREITEFVDKIKHIPAHQR